MASRSNSVASMGTVWPRYWRTRDSPMLIPGNGAEGIEVGNGNMCSHFVGLLSQNYN